MRLKPAIRKGVLNKDGKANVKIEIIHAGKTRYISTEFYIEPSMFRGGKVVDRHPNAAFINLELQKKILGFETKLLPIHAQLKSMDVAEILEILKSEREFSRPDFFEFGNRIADLMDNQGRKKNAEVYRTGISVVKNYTGKDYLPFEEISYQFVIGLDHYLKGKGIKPNSRGNYFRTIRAIINEALRQFDNDEKPTYLHPKYYPFKKFSIPQEKTRNRALTVEEIKKFASSNLSGLKAISRDIFMLSFYLIGINMKDLFFLNKPKNGRIEYRRAKTSGLYSIKLEPEAQEIIKRYAGEKKLLKFAEEIQHHENFTKKINKHLPDGLTTYFARHTWATIASSIGIPKDVISKALGHAENSVTDIYIDFDYSKVDEANRKVIDKVK